MPLLDQAFKTCGHHSISEIIPQGVEMDKHQPSGLG